jgi:hypothetical protein
MPDETPSLWRRMVRGVDQSIRDAIVVEPASAGSDLPV